MRPAAIILVFMAALSGCKEDKPLKGDVVERSAPEERRSSDRNRGWSYGVHVGPHLTPSGELRIGPRVGFGYQF